MATVPAPTEPERQAVADAPVVDAGSVLPEVAGPATGAEVLRGLGLEALIEFLETTAYGVCVTGDDHTWVYVNPAGERILGHALTDLVGQDYLRHFPEHEREVLLALEQIQRQGDSDFYTNTVLRPDGTECEMTWSGTVLHTPDGNELAPAIFHETTPVRHAVRSAARIGAASIDPTTGHSRVHVLDSLVREAVGATRAAAAALVVEDRHHVLRLLASAGGADGLAEVVRRSGAGVADLPGADDLARGRSVFLSDAAHRLRSGPRTADWVEQLAPAPWTGAAQFGVTYDGHLAGSLVVVLPQGLTSPSESERTLWSSLADQAGIALGADRFRAQVSEVSALSERSRIARDLHDSVSQALFSLNTRAQVIRRALTAQDLDLALEAAQDLELLSRSATSQMREMLTELSSPGTVAVDVTEALHELADQVAHLHGLPVEVQVSPAVLPDIAAATAEHLVRIVSEALHNAVKHASASHASVRATLEDEVLTLLVADNGCGFDVTDVGLTGHGQRTMRERAAMCGAELTVTAAPGLGTAVTVSVPVSGS